jgi:hypothetical protein
MILKELPEGEGHRISEFWFAYPTLAREEYDGNP